MKNPSQEAIIVANNLELARSIVRSAGSELHKAIRMLNRKNKLSQLDKLLIVEEKCWQVSDLLRRALKNKDLWSLQV